MTISGFSDASTVEVNLSDQNGMPVQHAVISIPSVKIAKNNRIAIMDQINKQFYPHVLVVQKGQSVDFPNSDNIRHHVYSFSQPNQFEIKLFSGSEAQALSFKHSSVVVLGCNVHDNMIGYIYVNDGELTAITDEFGKAIMTLPDRVKSIETIDAQIWHPELSPMQLERFHVNLPLNTSYNAKLPIVLATIGQEVKSGFKKKFGD